jgi:hypothetical protein
LILESSLHFWQASLKIFKKLKWANGEFLSSKMEETLLKKLKKKQVPKGIKYFMDLGAKMNIEQGLQQSSWLTYEYALILSKFILTQI